MANSPLNLVDISNTGSDPNDVLGPNTASFHGVKISQVQPGAKPATDKPAQVNLKTLQTNSANKPKPELRTRIKVPIEYQSLVTVIDLGFFQGIIFPYTPTINYEVKADYATVNPTHSNYTQYFYQHSSVGIINITGRFTVQNQRDAENYLSTVHLLKALTKMKFGNDENAGAPPPVCRLYSYGAYMIDNVPIVINSFRIDLPNEVDYYTIGKDPAVPQENFKSNDNVKAIAVPTLATIAITCYPMYSRQEMLNASVHDWLYNYKGNYL
jgi:hypothetical protein